MNWKEIEELLAKVEEQIFLLGLEYAEINDLIQGIKKELKCQN